MSTAPDASKKSGNFGLLLIFILFAAAACAVAYLYLKDTTPPSIALVPEGEYVGKAKTFTLTVGDPGSGLKTLSVQAVRGDKRISLVQKDYPSRQRTVTETFSLDGTKLADGTLQLEITAVDGSYYNMLHGNKATLARALTLDTKAPRLSVLSGAHNVKPGGSGCIVYSVDEEPARSGVQVGDRFYPGYPQPSGHYAALFAFPDDMEEQDFNPQLTAEDRAGNTRTRSFRFHVSARSFRHRTINIPDSFLERKMPDFEDEVPGDMSDLERFLKVNNEVRTANRAKLYELGRLTSPTPLWQGGFERFKGAPMAFFGDRRAYIHNGEEIDHQTHLGEDIASTANANVPAANNGVVVFAGDMGIYGNVVIIDHGLGLQTLYAHLEEITVNTNDSVERGALVGRTGTTGLAGGDHLHFGVIVSGTPVTPREWWDGRWIRHNVTDRME